MKIVAVRTIPLGGATHDHGWPGGTDPNVQYNTLVEVVSDEGITGLGSCYTTRALVEGALQLLSPHLLGEAADEPDRVSEKLRQSMFWLGRGGSVEHAISGIDIALWDLWGKALGQPVSKLLGGNYRDRIKPYASILFDQPEPLRDALLVQKARGFRAIKMGWRPFGRVSRQLDELLIRTARETVGEDVELMVDAGGSEQFWPHSVNWARETARMLGDYGITWFEEALKPDDVEGFAQLQATSPVLIATGEVLSRRQAFQPFLLKRAVDIIQPDLTKCGGLSEARKLAWPTIRECCWCRMAGTRPLGWRRTWPCRQRCQSPAGSSIKRVCRTSKTSWKRRSNSMRTACFPFPPAPASASRSIATRFESWGLGTRGWGSARRCVRSECSGRESAVWSRESVMGRDREN
jgi:L-alanine-DL-glutamate epimerase-like enolase superfamily enzyme